MLGCLLAGEPAALSTMFSDMANAQALSTGRG